MDDDESTLLLTEHGAKEDNVMFFNKEKVMPKLNTGKNDKVN